MKKYFILIISLYVFGCESESPVNETIISGRTYQGSFQITTFSEQNGSYTESGSIRISFADTAYNYTAYYNDTTSGRGKLFKNGLRDGGNYSKLSGNQLSMLDSAVIYGLGTATGSPSLYLNGVFKVIEEKHHIILTNTNDVQECKIELGG